MTCLFRHKFGPWGKVQELPIWLDDTVGRSRRAIGWQPIHVQTYIDPSGKLYGREAVNHDYKLVGKIIEQRRTCTRCSFTQIHKQTWSI